MVAKQRVLIHGRWLDHFSDRPFNSNENNPEAARDAGIRVERITWVVYVLAEVLADWAASPGALRQQRSFHQSPKVCASPAASAPHFVVLISATRAGAASSEADRSGGTRTQRVLTREAVCFKINPVTLAQSGKRPS